MRFQPTDFARQITHRRALVAISVAVASIDMQATHGVVSGAPTFFKRAFGNSVDAFEALLLRPQHYIFNREWYDRWEVMLSLKSTFELLGSSVTRSAVNYCDCCPPVSSLYQELEREDGGFSD